MAWGIADAMRYGTRRGEKHESGWGVCKYVYGMQCVMGMSQVVNTCAVC